MPRWQLTQPNKKAPCLRQFWKLRFSRAQEFCRPVEQISGDGFKTVFLYQVLPHPPLSYFGFPWLRKEIFRIHKKLAVLSHLCCGVVAGERWEPGQLNERATPKDFSDTAEGGGWEGPLRNLREDFERVSFSLSLFYVFLSLCFLGSVCAVHS